MTPRKQKEEQKPNGRPSKYKKAYCKKMIEFFDIPHILEIEKEKVTKDGEVVTHIVERANKLPTFEKFAVSIGVHRDTLHEWSRTHQEFSDTYSKCKNLQKDMLIYLGMIGLYNAPFTQFVAKNITDMKDTQQVEQTTRNIVVENPKDKQALEDV